MIPEKKTQLIQVGIVVAIFIVALFSIITFGVAGECWWAFIFPFAAVIYGCVIFFKKYYPKK